MRKKKPAVVNGIMPSVTQQELMYDDMEPRDTDHKVFLVKKVKWLPRFKWNLKLSMDDKLEGDITL